MKKQFGYFINKDRQIDYDANNLRISRFIDDYEPSFKMCISCGTCSATCTAAQFTDFNLRRLMVLIRRGEENNIPAEFDKCMLCGKCTLVCPRGVNTRNIIIAVKKAIKHFQII